MKNTECKKTFFFSFTKTLDRAPSDLIASFFSHSRQQNPTVHYLLCITQQTHKVLLNRMNITLKSASWFRHNVFTTCFCRPQVIAARSLMCLFEKRHQCFTFNFNDSLHVRQLVFKQQTDARRLPERDALQSYKFSFRTATML